jgi:hypothetical protein
MVNHAALLRQIQARARVGLNRGLNKPFQPEIGNVVSYCNNQAAIESDCIE